MLLVHTRVELNGFVSEPYVKQGKQ